MVLLHLQVGLNLCNPKMGIVRIRRPSKTTASFQIRYPVFTVCRTMQRLDLNRSILCTAHSLHYLFAQEKKFDVATSVNYGVASSSSWSNPM